MQIEFENNSHLIVLQAILSLTLAWFVTLSVLSKLKNIDVDLVEIWTSSIFCVITSILVAFLSGVLFREIGIWDLALVLLTFLMWFFCLMKYVKTNKFTEIRKRLLSIKNWGLPLGALGIALGVWW